MESAGFIEVETPVLQVTRFYVVMVSHCYVFLQTFIHEMLMTEVEISFIFLSFLFLLNLPFLSFSYCFSPIPCPYDFSFPLYFLATFSILFIFFFPASGLISYFPLRERGEEKEKLL